MHIAVMTAACSYWQRDPQWLQLLTIVHPFFPDPQANTDSKHGQPDMLSACYAVSEHHVLVECFPMFDLSV